MMPRGRPPRGDRGEVGGGQGAGHGVTAGPRLGDVDAVGQHAGEVQAGFGFEQQGADVLLAVAGRSWCRRSWATVPSATLRPASMM